MGFKGLGCQSLAALESYGFRVVGLTGLGFFFLGGRGRGGGGGLGVFLVLGFGVGMFTLILTVLDVPPYYNPYEGLLGGNIPILGFTQRLQYSLITEYSLNNCKKPFYISRYLRNIP